MAISADVSDPMDPKKGGTAAWGRFLQSKEEEAILYVQVPEGTRGRNVSVVFKSAALKVTVHGKACMDDALSHPVVADECEWQMEDGSLVITLRKQAAGWWDRVLAQDPAVDTSTFDTPKFMLGDMEEHQHDSMRDHVARMLGSGSQGSAGTM